MTTSYHTTLLQSPLHPPQPLHLYVPHRFLAPNDTNRQTHQFGRLFSSSSSSTPSSSNCQYTPTPEQCDPLPSPTTSSLDSLATNTSLISSALSSLTSTSAHPSSSSSSVPPPSVSSSPAPTANSRADAVEGQHAQTGLGGGAIAGIVLGSATLLCIGGVLLYKARAWSKRGSEKGKYPRGAALR